MTVGGIPMVLAQSDHPSVCPSVSSTWNNFLHPDQILFKFHACINLIDISDDFKVSVFTTHGFQDAQQNGHHSMKFFGAQKLSPFSMDFVQISCMHHS